MKQNWHNQKILKDIISRKYTIKKELKLLILKSILQNQNISKKKRTCALIFLQCKNKKKWKITLQQNRCLLTGKSKTTFKFSTFSRQMTKKMIDLGYLQNIKSSTY